MAKNDAAQPYVIPRASLTWLLVSHVAVILPHVPRIPIWMSLISALCVLWRVLVFRQRASFPSKLVKNILVAAGFGGILFQYRTLIGAEAGTSLLLVMFDLKLLEMIKKRDAYVVVVLAYFVAATQFMFSSTLITAIYGFSAITCVTAALLGLHQNSTHRQPLRTAKLAVILVLQAAPLMIAFFYLFPRMPQLWATETPQKRAQLGFSEEMSPGDFSELGKSDGLAFRAEFVGDPPPVHDLYWRGAVLTRFDGHKWKVTEYDESLSIPWVDWGNDLREYYWNRQAKRKADSVLDYSIIMEPHEKKWLFALDTPVSHSEDIGLTREFTLVRKEAVNESIRYSVSSYKSYLIDEKLEDELVKLNTALPAKSNPKTRAFAEKLFRQSQQNPKRYILNILKWYNTDNFTYTMKPPKLGQDSIDEFLFTTQRGFCEHFSSATTFLARAVGIPARVVVGYQGGEWNALGKHYLIHQYDAHAWTEVWLENEGWVRVDGTAAVSPDRIEKGVDSALQQEQASENSPFSSVRLKHFPVLGQLRFALDYIDFAWSKYVLNFDKNSQIELFQRLFGGFDPQRAGLVVLLICGSVLGLIALCVFSDSSSNKVEPATQIYLAFCRKLAKRGFERENGETPNAFAARVVAASPMMAEIIADFTSAYSALTYAKPIDVALARDALKRLEILLGHLEKNLDKIPRINKT